MTWAWVAVSVGLARAAEPIEIRRSPGVLNVRAAPSLDGTVRGKIEGDEPFLVYARVAGDGCGGEGWGQVAAGGYSCLEDTTPTTDPPVALPRLLAFDAPDPLDYKGYLKKGAYVGGTRPPMAPYIYGKRWRRWQGHVWSSAEAWIAGEPPVDQLDLKHTYSFVAFVDTERGRALVRPNGSVVPVSEVFIFPVTGFHGRDLAASPLPAGTSVAWVVERNRAPVHASPARAAKVVTLLAYQTELVVKASPVGDGRWWEIPDALGAGVPGYVSGSMIRRWTGSPRPAETGADEGWIDVDIDQQTLALMRGDAPTYVTLISTGVSGHETPEGTFRIYDKSVSGDMTSLVGAPEEDAYHVEEVPWVMHFKPRYALHAAFWHWGFGEVASHGCVNLSPRDARYVFDRIAPTMPPGFGSIDADEREPGTLVRIRRGAAPRRG